MFGMTDFDQLYGNYPAHILAVASPYQIQSNAPISEERRKALQNGRKKKSAEERQAALMRLQSRFDGFPKGHMFSLSTLAEAYNDEKGTTLEIAKVFVDSLIERELIDYKPIPGRKSCRKK